MELQKFGHVIMTTQKVQHQPWLRIASDLKKDAPFFGTIGLVCGFVQVVGYRHFDKAEWGSELLQEHIAVNSLLLLVMCLLLARGLTEWHSKRWTPQCIKNLIEHVANRTVTFGSVAASTIMGFAISAAIFGAYIHASKFALAALFFAAIAEVSANPLRSAELSKGYRPALYIIIATPFLFLSLEPGFADNLIPR
jgi:hypothetical protein